MFALPGFWLRDAYVAAQLFPLLWWVSGGGWLALAATPAVLFGMLCHLAPHSFLTWCAPHPIPQCVVSHSPCMRGLSA